MDSSHGFYTGLEWMRQILGACRPFKDSSYGLYTSRTSKLVLMDLSSSGVGCGGGKCRTPVRGFDGWAELGWA